VSDAFYASLPVHLDIHAIARAENFAPLPADWHVATCDVRNSTLAIEAGRYKQVNTVGATAVTAVLNAAGATDIPFIFEGDGSAFCVPPGLLGDVRAALVKTQEVARKSFGLDLRVATLPVAKVREAGFDIRVARIRISENYVQAAFAGGGMAWADRAMKDPAGGAQYAVDATSTPARGNLAGLECRWQDIPSPHGETVSLMVRAATRDPAAAAKLYRKLIAKVAETYGSDEASHPVTLPGLSPALSSERLFNEVGVCAGGRGPLYQWYCLMRTRGYVILGWFLMKFGLHTEETDWSRYKQTLARNSDVRKFNDVYRQILAGTAAQRAALTAWLEYRYAKGDLVYGMHVTDRAHMTCLVFNYSGRHLHFIDGADGGFALAARAFKERAAKLTV
jgi:hypothetical protein